MVLRFLPPLSAKLWGETDEFNKKKSAAPSGAKQQVEEKGEQKYEEKNNNKERKKNQTPNTPNDGEV